MIENTWKILETTYLLIQGIPKKELIAVLGLGAYIPKAEKVKSILEKETENLNKNSKKKSINR